MTSTEHSATEQRMSGMARTSRAIDRFTTADHCQLYALVVVGQEPGNTRVSGDR